MNKESRIFITGATGFVGSYILRALVRSGFKKISVMIRDESKTDLIDDLADHISWIKGDILDIPFLDSALNDCDIIIHTAAIVSPDSKNNKDMLNVSVDGTANLVNIALEKGSKKFIFISSVAALGRKKSIETIDENHIFTHSQFDSYYGLSKFLAEQEVWRASAEGLPVTILNPSTVLGVGFWDQSSVSIFKKIYKGLKFYPPGKTGFVDVRDVADSVIAVINHDFFGERFIISGKNLSYKTLFEIIAQNLRVPSPDKAINGFNAIILPFFEQIKGYFTNQKSLITKDTIIKASVVNEYVNDKSINVLGMEYRNIQDTIENSCELFLKSYPLGKKFAVL